MNNLNEILSRIDCLIRYEKSKTLLEQSKNQATNAQRFVFPKNSSNLRIPTEQESEIYAYETQARKQGKSEKEIQKGVEEIKKKYTPAEIAKSKDKNASRNTMSNLPDLSRKNIELENAQKKYQEILDKVRKRKSIRYNLDVPEGFSPFNFDDYVDELGPYQDIITKIENKYRGEGFQGQGTRVYTEKMPFEVRKSYDEAKNNLKKKREEIRPKYYNKKFPKGITQEDLEFFDTQKTNLKNELNKLEKKYTKIGYPSSSNPSSDEPYEYFDDKSMSPQDRARYDSLKKDFSEMDVKFGYDARSGFDEFMDSNWGLVAQVAVNTLLLIGGGLSGGASWALLADTLFNTGIGLYQLNREQQSEAVMSFVFAALPYMKNLWNIAGKPAKAVTDSIAKKLAGVSLETADEVNAAMSLLTPEELKAWKKIAYLPESQITPELQELIKSRKEAISKITTKGQRAAIKGKEIILGTATDLGIAVAASSAFDKLKEVLKKYGIPVKTEEDLNDLKTWFNKEATPNDLQRILLMSDSFLSNNPTEVESMKKVGFKIKDYNKKIYDYSINQKEVEKGKKDKTIYQKRVDSLKKYLE